MSMSEYSLSDIAAASGEGGFGGGNSWIVLIILFAMIFGWGGNGFGNRVEGGAGQVEMQNGFNNATVVGKLDRLGDGISSLGYELNNSIMGGFNQTQRDMCSGFTATDAAIQQARSDAQNCCCETNRNIDSVRYDAAINTAAINATTTAQTQKILDAICENRMAEMQSQINQLQMQSALCGVVRYPNSIAYNAGNFPFCNCSA
jgi:hypothetical protein